MSFLSQATWGAPVGSEVGLCCDDALANGLSEPGDDDGKRSRAESMSGDIEYGVLAGRRYRRSTISVNSVLKFGRGKRSGQIHFQARLQT